MAVVGIDACRRGWVALVRRAQQPLAAHFLSSIGDIAAVVDDAEVIGIDIPIGLPVNGPRQADLQARGVVGPRRSSVFLTPVRAALEAPTHQTATTTASARTGSGVSQQAFALRTKIFEVERWLPVAPCAVYEVHPEVSFTVMCGRPASASKKSWQGTVERRDALVLQGIDLDQLDPHLDAMVGVDDVIDAAAAAFGTAQRVLDGRAISLPDPPEADEAGRAMAIWA